MPRIAILSDIHGNLPALNNVLEILEKESPDEWICLGDLVGYGPHPSECVQIIMERGIPTVMGNHDAGVCGKLNLKHFRNPNRTLIEKSRELLSEEQLSWLSNLPLVIEGEDWIAAHATPSSPEKWTYVESAFQARDLLRAQVKNLCFVGHTHRPALVSEKFGVAKYNKDGKYLINPGSVGQSRDGDSRSSCCIVDTDLGEYKNIRVQYNKENIYMALQNLGFARSDAKRLMAV